MDTAILALVLPRMCLAIGVLLASAGLRLSGPFRKPGFWAYLIRRAELKSELRLAVLRDAQAQALSRDLRPGVAVRVTDGDYRLEIRVPPSPRCACGVSGKRHPAHFNMVPHCRVPRRTKVKGELPSFDKNKMCRTAIRGGTAHSLLEIRNSSQNNCPLKRFTEGWLIVVPEAARGILLKLWHGRNLDTSVTELAPAGLDI